MTAINDTVHDAVTPSTAAYALTPKRVAILLWALLPVLALLGRAIYALTTPALDALSAPEIGPLHIALTIGWVGFMAFAEGYRGFQQSFSPRVVNRAFDLAADPRTVDVVFAPFYAVGYYSAPKRTKIVAWSVTLGVIALVLAVRQVDQPWRGLIDAGVVVGLAWGTASLILLALARLRR